jgi:hypothetical protein
MPAPGSKTVHKKPKVASLTDFVEGNSPVLEPKLPLVHSFLLESGIKLIKQWAPRQILKLLTALTAAVGGSMAADGQTTEATATFILGLLIGLIEMSTSKLAKSRYLRKIEEAKAKS